MPDKTTGISGRKIPNYRHNMIGDMKTAASDKGDKPCKSKHFTQAAKQERKNNYRKKYFGFSIVYMPYLPIFAAKPLGNLPTDKLT